MHIPVSFIGLYSVHRIRLGILVQLGLLLPFRGYSCGNSSSVTDRSESGTAYVAFAVGALLALTIINLCAVDIFAKIESGLAITKVCVIILFIILAFGIWVGLWGSDGFLGAKVNFGNADMSFGEQLFPNGMGIVMTSMVVVLVTFQGTEIVGLTAAEAENPDESVPKGL